MYDKRMFESVVIYTFGTQSSKHWILLKFYYFTGISAAVMLHT